MINTVNLLFIFCLVSRILSHPHPDSLSRTRRLSQKPLSTSGDYAYKAPGPNDKRGPCPGLNALANNGYMNRNGISTPEQVISASSAIGLGPDVAAGLAALAVIAGDALTFSIGNASGTVGAGTSKHNVLEGDASYKSCDCNNCPTKNGCDNFDFNDTVWTTTYNAAQLNGGLFGIPTFQIAAKQRYDECVANNSKCVFGPIQFVFHYFTPCLFALTFPNGTDGKATEDIIRVWMGYFYENGQRKGMAGGGQIPKNWYPHDPPRTFVDAAPCILAIYLAHPVLLGAKVNGVWVPSAEQIPVNATANDIVCFMYQAIFKATPNIAATLLAVASYLNRVFTVKPWNCPVFNTGH
ncbi:unnamed protein product [Didymodactylos carnosus]|uniref:Heme haloperoxidase family profile domain-containing protein n=1 Tax=Didymodactylos carnosus TaxID=1234261 RepID=A0A8S2E2G9_9BILA|nr:unnamed protein product [Didymodactylos carnosus]CAF3819180.1 unnamed protein product [Didymodactylos carnosus]